MRNKRHQATHSISSNLDHQLIVAPGRFPNAFNAGNPRASYLGLLAPITARPCSRVPSLPNVLDICDCFALEDISPFRMSPLYEAFPEGSVDWVAAQDVIIPHVSSFLHRNGIDGRYTSVHAVQWMGEEISETYHS